VLGRGGGGKTTLAVQLGRVTGIPVVELDAHLWSADLVPLDRDRWGAVQGTPSRCSTSRCFGACGTPPGDRASGPICGGGC